MPSGLARGLCPRCAAGLLQSTQTETCAEHEGKPAFTPPTVEELAPAFPQLEILEMLGRGGMGAVYKARQKHLERIVALKILPPGIGETPAFSDRFAREAKSLARLNHPGIVTIHDFGRTGELYYFIMEYVDGMTLRQLLNGARISPREALAIVPQICDALQYAHDEGIVHRDIKPENILIDRRGRVKIADFGIAKLIGLSEGISSEPGHPTPSPALTEAGKIMGTPAYMAPEQVKHPADVDHRADIYSLGVVFYQMLTGDFPSGQIQPPSSKVQIDVRLDAVVLQALEKEPNRRYQHASEVKTAVETIVGKPSSHSGAPEVLEPLEKPVVPSPLASSRWFKIFLGTFLFVLGLWSMLLLLSGNDGLVGFIVKGSPVALVAGAVAAGGFLLITREWYFASLALFSAVFLLWCSMIAALGPTAMALPLGVLSVVVYFFVAKRSRLPRGFLVPFTIVFLLVFGTGALVTALLPDTYTSICRIRLIRQTPAPPAKSGPQFQVGGFDPYFLQTEFQVIQSRAILGKVAQDLDLSRKWAKQQGSTGSLSETETLARLKARIDLRPVRNTELIEIQGFSEHPEEAAVIANKVADVYQNSESNTSKALILHSEILDLARPALKPVRPNRALNLTIAALGGLLLGTIFGIGAASRKRALARQVGQHA